jgi:hypothetical protein
MRMEVRVLLEVAQCRFSLILTMGVHMSALLWIVSQQQWRAHPVRGASHPSSHPLALAGAGATTGAGRSKKPDRGVRARDPWSSGFFPF